jgi:hypothetical protein
MPIHWTSGPLERKRGAYTVTPWNTLAGDNIYSLNGPIAQRQLPFNQETKSLKKPLDK